MGENISENAERRLQETRQYWDNLAPTFDDEPDHGLGDSLVLGAWTSFLKTWLPLANATILDVGCGTGSLSVVLSCLGHKVTGIDLSPVMINLAKEKAITKGLRVEFHVMDAAFPDLNSQKFSVIICRHLLWTLPEPKQVLQRWMGLLKQPGKFILVEGHWGTGVGLQANDVIEMLPPSFTNVTVINLSDNSNFWGGSVTDERYAIIADLNQ